uniref:Medium-chain acyl-CoA ligase ACSF2, mitochondrial n=1 Tax=Myripristis murdjan TaxID=586833 RepID=A0A667WH76_9TELE
MPAHIRTLKKCLHDCVLQKYVYTCKIRSIFGFLLAIKTDFDFLGMVHVFISYPLGLSQVTSLNAFTCRSWSSNHVEDVGATTDYLTSSYVHGTSSLSLLPWTVGQSLEKAVDRWPDREAVVFVQDVLHFKKLVSLQVSVNPAYQLKEVEYTLKKVQCKAVLCPTSFKTQRYCDMLREICPEIDSAASGMIKSSRLPDLRMVIVTDSRQPGMLHVDDVMQAGESHHTKELMDLQTKLSCDDPINIQFTSGTTGNPKGATLSHHNIVNNAYFTGLRIGYGWRPQVRVCIPAPLHHAFGTVLGGICTAVHGITLIFPSVGYDSRASLETIQKEKCNILYGTPTMYIDMLNQADLHKFDLSSLEAGIIGGSPCPADLVKKIITDMKMKEIMVGYGTTENSPVTFLGFPRDNEELKTSTVGCVMNHTEAKVVDTFTGETVPLGVSGELLTRGYCVMLEYWEEPEKTREVISKDRWYRTGDMANLDHFGYCRIVGRIKDMIIRGGENIYPAEIEQFLYTHPKIQEVEVIGVKDERFGEQVCACVKLKEGQTSSVDEIRAYCKGQISHFKIPHYVIFVDSYPLTFSGKIQKVKLREQMEKKLGL